MKRYYIRASRWDPEPPTLVERPTGTLLGRAKVIDALAGQGLDYDEVISMQVLLTALGISEAEFLAAQEACK